MKSSTFFAAAIALIVLLAIPVGLAAQQHNTQHHYYRLIDLGTLGGAQSLLPLGRSLNRAGTVTGCADTLVSDPNYPNFNPFLSPFGPDPYIFHTFEYQHGTIGDLGALPGVNSSCQSFITDSGLIVGGSENGLIDPLNGWPAMEAVVWNGSQIASLGTFGGNESFAIWANNHGQVVGAAANTIPDPYSVFFGWGTQTRAFLWTEAQGLKDLGTLGGPDALATGITDRGQIFGASYTSYIPNPITLIPPFDGFVYENGQMTDIPNTFGGAQFDPFWVNNRGQLTGTASLPGETMFHPFLWDNGTLTDLGTLGGDSGEGDFINEAGQIVGQSTFAGDQIYHGFLWYRGVLTDLGTFAGDSCSNANSINLRGQIVGQSGICFVTTRAVLWENGQIFDLNTLVASGPSLRLFSANDINERGEIAGVGVSNGEFHVVLLTPCDENHPGVAGCDYSMVDASALPSRPTLRLGSSPAAASPWRNNRFPFLRRTIGPRN
jgi:probable HAF family extracellular repeat protein